MRRKRRFFVGGETRLSPHVPVAVVLLGGIATLLFAAGAPRELRFRPNGDTETLPARASQEDFDEVQRIAVEQEPIVPGKSGLSGCDLACPAWGAAGDGAAANTVEYRVYKA